MSRDAAGQMTSTGEQKKYLRRVLLEERKNIAPQDRCIWDSGIAIKLFNMPEYQSAHTLLIFLSTPWEVSTAAPIAHAIGMEKQVAVPRWGGGRMEFCNFTDYQRLVRGSMGILQPTAEAERVTDFSSALCIVPALAADRQGFRIGYGGGYYDRFLSVFKGNTVILTYDGMVLGAVPTEPHDLPVDSIITPNGVIRLKQGG